MAEIESLLARLPNTPDPTHVVDVMTEAFEQLGDDPEYLEGMRTVVPGAEKLYGVRVPRLRELARGVVREYRSQPGELKEIAVACWERGSREHRLAAVFLLSKLKKGLDPQERWSLGVRFLPDVSNWEECDQLCHALLGEALAKSPEFMDELETWLDDDNKWVRRAALVSTVLLRRADFPDALARDLDRRALRMCERLLDDPEKYIRKAVDWAIRETIKRRYDLARAWMMARAASELSSTARSTLKLASKKLVERDRESWLRVLEIA
jgi:3-methyladenine DNA glycosylase AlkD